MTSDHDALGGVDWAIEFARDERSRRLECPKLPEFHYGAEFSGNPRVSLPVFCFGPFGPRVNLGQGAGFFFWV